MEPTGDLRTVLGLGPLARGRLLFARLGQVLCFPLWFPHVPLALLTLPLGVLKVSRQATFMLTTGLANWVGPESAAAITQGGISVASRTVLGIFLLVMAVGLLFRSRLAWVIVVALLLGHLALSVRTPEQMANLTSALNLVLLGSLLLARRQFSRSSLTAETLFAVTSVVALVTLAVLGSLEVRDQFDPPIPNLSTALYFVVVIMSTVGYGDILPQTTEARMLVIALILLGITIFTASLSAVLVPLANRHLARALRHEETKVERSNHYIIVGDTTLAENTAKALHARGQKVTFIIETSSDTGVDPELDIVRGDPSSLDTLTEAGALKARALLALSEAIKTVALVNSARNLASVKRVRPDVIIAPSVVGGELLAMALSGEHVDGDAMINQLLYVKP